MDHRDVILDVPTDKTDSLTLPREAVRPLEVRAARSIFSAPARPRPFVERWWVPYLMCLTDIVVLVAIVLVCSAMTATLNGWTLGAMGMQQTWVATGLSLGLALVPLGLALAGLYPGYGMGAVDRLRRRVLVTAWMLGLLLVNVVVLAVVLPSSSVSVVHWLMVAGGAITLGPMADALLRCALVGSRVWGTPVVILGGGRAEQLVQALRQHRHLGLVPICIFDDDRTTWGRHVERVPVVGPLAKARHYTRRARVALLSNTELGRERVVRLTSRLSFPRIIVVPDLSGLSTQGVEAQDLGGFLGLHVRKDLLLRRNILLKRAFDYALGLVLFLLALPVMVLLGVWVRWASPGPALYSQQRVGLGGRKIKVWKLRTMYVDADDRLNEYLASDAAAAREWKRRFKLRDDPRIVPGVGHLARQHSLDELPQLWNVLRGEMSLVGPRPFPRYHLQSFRRDFRALRQTVLPGLTGLWQVSSRSEGDLHVQEQLDTCYIRNWSIWLDLHLLGRTIAAVLRCRGAY